MRNILIFLKRNYKGGKGFELAQTKFGQQQVRDAVQFAVNNEIFNKKSIVTRTNEVGQCNGFVVTGYPFTPEGEEYATPLWKKRKEVFINECIKFSASKIIPFLAGSIVSWLIFF